MVSRSRGCFVLLAMLALLERVLKGHWEALVLDLVGCLTTGIGRANLGRDTGRAMARGVHVDKYRAVFPPGYIERSRWHRAHIRIARRSRRMRALVFGTMPYGRPRTHMVARFFREIIDDAGRRRYDHFIPAVHPEAEVELWGLGTYHGRDGWQAALSEWLDAFDEPLLEMTEFIDPGGGQVLCVATVGGAVKGTGVPIEQKFYILVRVEAGMAVKGHLYESRQDALEAVGLSE